MYTPHQGPCVCRAVLRSFVARLRPGCWSSVRILIISTSIHPPPLPQPLCIASSPNKTSAYQFLLPAPALRSNQARLTFMSECCLRRLVVHFVRRIVTYVIDWQLRCTGSTSISCSGYVFPKHSPVRFDLRPILTAAPLSSFHCACQPTTQADGGSRLFPPVVWIPANTAIAKCNGNHMKP